MEYLREEELDKEEDKETKDTISEEENKSETKKAWKPLQEKQSKVDYVSMLRVVGKTHSWCKSDHYPSEKKVMPLAVLVAFIIYFGIAATFYFE